MVAQISHMNEATICSLQKQEKVICKAVSERARDKSVVKDEMVVPAAEIVMFLTLGSIFQRPRGRLLPKRPLWGILAIPKPWERGGRQELYACASPAGLGRVSGGPQLRTSWTSFFALSGLETGCDPGRWARKDPPQALAKLKAKERAEGSRPPAA